MITSLIFPIIQWLFTHNTYIFGVFLLAYVTLLLFKILRLGRWSY